MLTDVADRLYPLLEEKKTDNDDSTEFRVNLVVRWILVLLSNYSLVFYIFYSVNNINFKVYLYMLMFGYGIDKHFESASLFVKASPFYSGEDESFTLITDEDLQDNDISKITEDLMNNPDSSKSEYVKDNFAF